MAGQTLVRDRGPDGLPAGGRRLALICEDTGELGAAREWHRAAAADGDASSAHDLGFLAYAAGDEEETVHWWECAARSGHADSAYCLGLFLQASRDPEGAEAYYRLSAKSEHPGAASQLGGIALSRRDLRSARAWFEQAAGAGRLEDQRMAGFVCVELGDARGASHWFGRGAAGGRRESAFNFGLLLIAEFGDLDGGRHWFRQAALAGHHRAAVELGGLLSAAGPADRGRGVAGRPAAARLGPPAEPELVARAELAAAATGRGRRRADAGRADRDPRHLGPRDAPAARATGRDDVAGAKDDWHAAAIERLPRCAPPCSARARPRPMLRPRAPPRPPAGRGTPRPALHATPRAPTPLSADAAAAPRIGLRPAQAASTAAAGVWGRPCAWATGSLVSSAGVGVEAAAPAPRRRAAPPRQPWSASATAYGRVTLVSA